MNLNLLQDELKKAMLSHNESMISTLRMLIAEIKNLQIDKQHELTEEEFVQLVRQQVKKRKEAVEAYKQANRIDLVDKETHEADLLSMFLPPEMSQEGLEKIVKETISQTGASGMADFGKVMGVVMGKVKGQTDGNKVAAIVKKLLS